jgi:16S rRNA (guanine966-N2)-methyltransferase
MRITGGRFRGRVLAAPKDAHVRPTSDKVRQAVFNLLAHSDFGFRFTLEGTRVIDLFAGTGALGLEAISHGARFSLFIDDDAESRALIRKNVEALALTGVTKIWRRNATSLGPMTEGAGGPFDLAFLDPPYREGLMSEAISSLMRGNWLAPETMVVTECAKRDQPEHPAGFALALDRVYGDTRVRILTRHSAGGG